MESSVWKITDDNTERIIKTIQSSNKETIGEI